jgi:hypothetical protein
MPPKQRQTPRKGKRTPARKRAAPAKKRRKAKMCNITGKTIGDFLFRQKTVSCRDLEVLLQDAGCDREYYRLRWDRVLRHLQGLSVPAKVSDYPPSLLDQITEIVGEEFFGETFVSEIRKRFKWSISMNVDPEPLEVTGAAATGEYHLRRDKNGAPGGKRFGTEIFADVFDVKLSASGGQIIMNDGWPCRTRLEWIMHVIGHELVHVLHFKLCGYPDTEAGSPYGHTRKFILLNRLVVGGIGYKWIKWTGYTVTVPEFPSNSEFDANETQTQNTEQRNATQSQSSVHINVYDSDETVMSD